MKEFLKRIKLLDHLTTSLELEKNEFVTRFKEHVDEGDMGFFDLTFEVFSTSKNEYIGAYCRDCSESTSFIIRSNFGS
ncbi:MAG: hypothetical protein WD077_14555 [Bacteroidia bacterium]